MNLPQSLASRVTGAAGRLARRMVNPLLAGLTGLVLAAGCANNPSADLANEQAKMDQSRSQFESTRKDPAIKPETHVAAGVLAESQSDPDRALAQYKEALRLDPRHGEALYRLAVLHAKLQQYPEAVETWKRYVKATNDDPGAYSNLGFCYELWGRPNEAETAYKDGIRRDPLNAPCHVNYGLMLARRGRMTEATVQLQTVLTPAEVHYNIASVYEGKGHKEQARAEYKKAIQLEPSFRDAQARLDHLQ